MFHKPLQSLALIGMLLGAVAGTSSVAQAANNGWNGEQPATMTGASIFSITGNTVTITKGATPTFLTIGGSFTNAQMLGISGIWIVDQNGATIGGVSSAPTGSTVTGSSPATTWDNVSGPAGYFAGSGYGNNTNFIQLVSDATLLSATGKQASGYDLGVFTFNGLSNPGNYKLGFDYLVASGGNGTTGRAFGTFALAPPPRIDAVPEPSEWLAMGMAAASVGGLMVRARRRKGGLTAA